MDVNNKMVLVLLEEVLLEVLLEVPLARRILTMAGSKITVVAFARAALTIADTSLLSINPSCESTRYAA